MNIREIGKRYLGNSVLVRKLLYFKRVNVLKVYQLCTHGKESSVDKTRDTIRDMKRCLFQHGAAYDEYFYFGFNENKDDTYRRSFITDSIRFKYFAKMNLYRNLKLFDNKQETYEAYGKYYQRDLLCLAPPPAEGALADFIDKHPVFIAKPMDLSCGNGIEMIDSKEYKDIKTLYDYLYSTKHYILEELIKQSAIMAQLHPHSVNTVRIATILIGTPGHYHAEVFHPFLKVGQHGSLVDNGGAGGIIVKIDVESGVLGTDGYDEANKRYIYHPDTGITFKGFQLPEWENAIALVKELALITPSNRYTGWDLAHTDHGWVMVEGNARGQFVGQQMCDRVGKRAEMEDIIKKCGVTTYGE